MTDRDLMQEFWDDKHTCKVCGQKFADPKEIERLQAALEHIVYRDPDSVGGIIAKEALTAAQ